MMICTLIAVIQVRQTLKLHAGNNNYACTYNWLHKNSPRGFSIITLHVRILFKGGKNMSAVDADCRGQHCWRAGCVRSVEPAASVKLCDHRSDRAFIPPRNTCVFTLENLPLIIQPLFHICVRLIFCSLNRWESLNSLMRYFGQYYFLLWRIYVMVVSQYYKLLLYPGNFFLIK